MTDGIAEQQGSPPRSSGPPQQQEFGAGNEPPSRSSPEPSQSDLQGHYVGPASGVSFFLRVQNRLHCKYSNFTFGDAPLPDFDPTYCVMVSREESEMLIRRYFDFTVPVDRFLHRPTIQAWLQEFHDTMGSMKGADEAPTQRALLWTMFAMAQDTLTPKPGAAVTEKRSVSHDSSSKFVQNFVNDKDSIRYFLLAEHQLSKERGAVSLASVQARLCQSLWLLSQSRMNHCWSQFGTAARLALAIGLHRNRRGDIAGSFSPIELECRRRTFWNAYCLDNYLSVALGRPRIFHDEDIDQELPSCLDDDNLSPTLITPSYGKGQSLMFAPVAYFKCVLSLNSSQLIHTAYTNT
jgi:hypothetical protein